MRIVLAVLVIFCAFLLQTRLSFLGVSPDLTALLAYYFGITGGATKGIAFGSFIGVLEDSLTGSILGPHLLGKGMAGFFSSFLSGSFFRWTPYLGMVAVFILTALDGLVVLTSRTVFETMPAPASAAVGIIVTQGLLNVIAGFFIKPGNA